MDKTIQIKNNLISRIRNSKDLNFLKALQTIFDTSEQELYQLNEVQNESINISRDEIKNGNYIDNSKAISEIKEWLKKK
ncbi:MAG TPA: hypothetical protein EYG92_10565 [Lutibacter sp.]|nr:hypothetical protein [Lutibacter sp.]